MNKVEIPRGHAHLQNGKSPAIYETVFKTLIRLANSTGLVEDNWEVKWNMRPKRKCGHSVSHALRQVELREKRKRMRQLHLEVLNG